MDVLAPSTQLPMAVLHAAGVAFSVCAGIVLLLDLWLLFSGRIKEEDLVMIQESEDLAALNRSMATTTNNTEPSEPP